MRKTVLCVFLVLMMVANVFTRSCLAVNDTSSTEFFLGKDNAFVTLYGVVPTYSEEYQRYIEDMMQKIVDAFLTSRFGTRTAQNTIKGLVPDEIYINKETSDEKIQAIDRYICSVLLDYFTFSVIDEEVWNCELETEGVIAYAEKGLSRGAFAGSWGKLKLGPTIGTLDDFCKKMNITKEVAIAFFFILESYDFNWLDGSSSDFLDEMMYNQFNLEPQYQKAIKLKEITDYENAIKEFELLNGYKDSEEQIVACERAIQGIKDITVSVMLENVYLRNKKGGAIKLLTKGKTVEITGYDESCAMFVATYGGVSGYLKGSGLSISKDELRDYFK